MIGVDGGEVYGGGAQRGGMQGWNVGSSSMSILFTFCFFRWHRFDDDTDAISIQVLLRRP